MLAVVLAIGTLGPIAGVLMLVLGSGAVRAAGAILLGLVLLLSFGSTVFAAVVRSRRRSSAPEK